jgi:hypothetical protein
LRAELPSVADHRHHRRHQLPPVLKVAEQAWSSNVMEKVKKQVQTLPDAQHPLDSIIPWKVCGVCSGLETARWQQFKASRPPLPHCQH